MGLLAIYAHGFGKGIGTVAFPVFLISGAIGFGIGDVSLFQALPRLGSRLSVLLVLCLSSPMAGIIEWLWLGTKLTVPEILCGSVILVGVAVALTPSEHLDWTHKPFVVGTAFGLSAAVCQALGAVLSRKAFQMIANAAESIDGITAAYQRILGGVLVSGLFLLIVKRSEVVLNAHEQRRERWRKALPWVLANGLSGPALGVSCYQWALKTTPTGVVLPIVALTPLVIVPFSHYIEGERPTLRSLLGGGVAVGGAVALALTRA